MAHSIVQDVTTRQVKKSGQIQSLHPVEEKNPSTLVIFNFKNRKHIKMRKLIEKKLKRAANRVK